MGVSRTGRPAATLGASSEVVHRRFERSVVAAPDAEALVHPGGRLTYDALNRRANGIARVLASHGIHRGDRVAVLLPRAPDLVAALLAILKSGACYVPLDPAYPAERNAFVAADVRAHAVVTTGDASHLLGAGAAVVRLDTCGAELDAQPAGDDDVEVDPHDLAYIIYTSGSTGRPKGVMIEHRSVCARLDWAHAAFTDAELGGMLASTSICFDLSVFEIFAPLCSGGRVLLAANVLELPELVFREEITALNTVPSAMSGLLALGALPASVRTVCLAGEPFPLALARALGAQPRVRRILNLYGPTEDTTYSTCAEVRPESDEAPLIGRPLPGTYARVLDEELCEVPPGACGELYLGGVGLARGYWDRPEQTAARFVDDPFSPERGARLYRSGDCVRLRAGGELDYMGRLDDQVKVRGHRVEPGEVERVLEDGGGVTESIVALVEAPGGDARLVAYYVGGAEPPALRAHLTAKLPAYMIPAAFVRLERIPRLPNGKRDRARLPAPEWGASAPAEQESELETCLARIVGGLLGVECVARDAAFAELGVHSLLAAQIVARVRVETGRDTSLSDVFNAGTVARLAAHLARATTAVPDEPRRGDHARGAPLSAAQRQMWFAAQLDPQDSSYNVPCAIRIAGRVEAALLERALGAVVRRHAALRTRIETRDGRPLQFIDDDARVTLAQADLSALRAHERWAELERRAAALAAQPIDLACAPLVRAAAFRFDEDDWCLVLVVHHAVFDDWSFGIVVRELAAAYAALEGGPGLVPAPPLQFADFCAWQDRRDWSAELAYFRAQLAGAPPVLDLSPERPRSARVSAAGAGAAFALDDDLVRAAAALAARAGATPFAVLLAAFELVLAQVSGRDDFVTLTAVAGRSHCAAEPVVGCFMNLLPLRSSLRGGGDVVALLRRVKERLFAALDRQQTPFERIVDDVRPPRDPRWTPLGQVAFGLQNVPEPCARVGERTWCGSELRTGRARLDLTLWIDRRADPPRASWTYRTDLFTGAAIARLHARFAHLLRQIVRAPETSVDALRLPPERTTMSETTPRKSFPGRSAPKVFAAEELARFEPGWGAAPLPALVRAHVPGVNLAEWGRAHRDAIETRLREDGGVLFRGFHDVGAAGFAEFARAISAEMIRYGERSSPRTEIADGVYTSTDHPADQPIVLHNEQSYTLNWPMKILFYCARAALRHGRTPLADSRKILARLAPSTVERFERFGVLYVRNYLPGISLPWSEVFQTHDRGEVEAYCRAAAVDFEWVGGERLRTRQRRAAVRRHPVTGERVWFNHALFFHVTSLPLEVSRSLRAAVDDADLPYNTYYGDGSPIGEPVLAELRAACEAETTAFDWENGDVLLLDNMLVAHGREPYEGLRKVRAAMADPYAALYGPPEAVPFPAEATA